MKSEDLSLSFRFRKRLEIILPKFLRASLDKMARYNRIYIIPTSIGFYFAFIAFVLFLIAVSYGHNLAYFATFLFFSFVSLSAIITNENISQLDVRFREEIIRGRSGREFFGTLVFKNNSGRTRYDISIEVGGIVVGHISEIKAASQCEVQIDLGLLELGRGNYRVKAITISTCFPFGLFYSWSWKGAEARILVQPEPQYGRVLNFTRPSQLRGEGTVSHQIGSEEFFEVRAHRPGESLARIDRRRSQNLGTPQIKEYRDENSAVSVIDLRLGEVEESLAKAIYWLDHSTHDVLRGLLLPNGQETKIGRGHTHIQELYDLLAAYEKDIEVII